MFTDSLFSEKNFFIQHPESKDEEYILVTGQILIYSNVPFGIIVSEDVLILAHNMKK